MKNLDLNAMGVVEMDAGEMKEVDGGFPILTALFFIGLAILVTIAVNDDNPNTVVEVDGVEYGG